MTRKWKLLALTFALLLAAGILSGCSSDDDPALPVDDIAPLVSGSDPSLDETDVSVDETIHIMFNEAMDTATVEAAVTLSTGTVTSMAWETDDKVLVIQHSDWAEGSHVTVTIDDTAADLAGNTLEAPAEFSFWVEQPTLVVLDIDPDSGTTGLTRNPVIKLLFSDDSMDYGSIETATYATDEMKASFDVSVTDAENDWVQMTFDQTLPANTQIRVSIGTGAHSSSGTNLESVYNFNFTTGTEIDITPPNIVSMVPENDSVIGIYTPYIEFTFDEAVDIDSFEFLGFSIPMYLAIMSADEPNLLEGGTVLRLPLTTPLPAGIKLEMLFDSFDDIFGNTQESDLDYSLTVDGSGDYYPVEDGFSYGMDVYEQEGTIGDTTPTWTQNYDEFYRVEVQEGDTFFLKIYPSNDLIESHEWEIYSKTGSAIMLHGFHESDIMPPEKIEYEEWDVLFEDPLTWLKLPPRVTTWSESTTIPIGEEMTVDLDVEGRIVEKIDELPINTESKTELPAFYATDGKADINLYWTDCWKAVIEHTMSVEGNTLEVGTETLWYAPGYGQVRSSSYEEDYEDEVAQWSRNDREWFPLMWNVR